MWWKTAPDQTQSLRHVQEAVEHLTDLVHGLTRSLADTSHEVRRLDLDIVGLEDKVKAFTGRISVRKRKDRQDDVEPEPEPDLNEMIRSGELSI